MTLLQQKQPITLTREDLHRNVWETPTSRLCAEYGISGRGLKKICDRLNVPTPSRGYWARLAAGQRVNQIPLPGATPTTHLQVIITPTLIPLPARPAPDIDPETAERLSNAQAARAGIVVPATLRHPHPAIAAWIARHEREISAEHRDRSVWGRPRLTKPFTSLERRQQRILSTLFKEIEKLGYKISGEAPYQLSIDAGRNKIKFTLREWIKQLRRPLTEEEKAGRSFSKQRWRQESVATGELILTIKTFIEHGLAREWRDKERPLEEQIGEIIAVLEVAGPILQKRQLKVEEAERHRWEEERRRKKNNRSKIRITADGDASFSSPNCGRKRNWRKVSSMRSKNIRLNSETTYGERTAVEWLKWARERQRAFDPLRWDTAGIWKDLASITAWDKSKPLVITYVQKEGGVVIK